MVGREEDVPVLEGWIGWKAGPDRGETGRRRAYAEESESGGTGELLPPVPLPLSLRERSSGVKRPFVLREKKRGEVGVCRTVGEFAREDGPRELEAVELLRKIFEDSVWVSKSAGWLVPGRRGDVARGVVDGV